MSELKYQTIDINKLIPYVNNARTHSIDQINRVASSIKEFGFMNPIIISEDNTILCGHARYEAAKKLGLKEVPCLLESHLTPAQRKAYILADNKMALDAGWDEELLKIEIESLQSEGFNLDFTGFLDEEIKDFLNKNSEFNFKENEEEDLFDEIEKLEKHYGVPYQGNKSRIADIIINILPSGNRLVDLFGGGGAITHCGILSNKWHEYLYNDINKMITTLFIDAVHGKYHDENRVITKDDFNKLKDIDAYVKYIWSFGNNGLTYLWGKEIEELKCQACRIILSSTKEERRKNYMDFVKLLNTSNCTSLDRLQAIEHLQALTQLEALQRLEAFQRLEITNINYKDYIYKEGDIVYCDVPYERLNKGKCDDYGLQFDSLEFYKWVKEQSYQIFFSSYEISDDSFYKTKIKEIYRIMGGASNNSDIEYLYSNKPIILESTETNK